MTPPPSTRSLEQGPGNIVLALGTGTNGALVNPVDSRVDDHRNDAVDDDKRRPVDYTPLQGGEMMGKGDAHKNVVISFRVPPEEQDQWKTLFREARTLGYATATARLRSEAHDWEDVYHQLQQAVLDIEDDWPGPDAPPDTAEALLEWVLKVAPQAGRLYHEMQQATAQLTEVQRALDTAQRQAADAAASGRQEHEQQLDALKNAVYAEQKTWHLTQRARDLVMDLARENWTTEDLTYWTRLLKSARVSPETYAGLWEEYGGIERMIRTLEPEIAKLQALRQQVMAEIQQYQAHAQRAEQAMAQARKQQVQAQEGLGKAQAALQHAQGDAQQWHRIATALGWWIPDIGQTWTAVVDKPAGMERALAATLLLAAVQREGAIPLTLPGSSDPRNFRLPVQIHLHELIPMLAPPELSQQIFAQIQQGQTSAPQPTGTAQSEATDDVEDDAPQAATGG